MCAFHSRPSCAIPFHVPPLLAERRCWDDWTELKKQLAAQSVEDVLQLIGQKVPLDPNDPNYDPAEEGDILLEVVEVK